MIKEEELTLSSGICAYWMALGKVDSSVAGRGLREAASPDGVWKKMMRYLMEYRDPEEEEEYHRVYICVLELETDAEAQCVMDSLAYDTQDRHYQRGCSI